MGREEAQSLAVPDTEFQQPCLKRILVSCDHVEILTDLEALCGEIGTEELNAKRIFSARLGLCQVCRVEPIAMKILQLFRNCFVH